MNLMDTALTGISETALLDSRPAQTARERNATPGIVMVAPNHFCVRYAINPWMNTAVQVDSKLALAQWQRLHDLIAESVDVQTISGDADLPDMCFSANAGLVSRGTFVTSRFRHAERQGEAELFESWMRRNGFAIRQLPPSIVFEGAGDALFDSEGRLWLGYGQRSELRSAGPLSAMLETEVIPLELSDPRFYHLDTCFCPLRSGHVVFYPNAFTEQGVAAIKRFVPAPLRIEATREDAHLFACNMVEVGESVIAHHVEDALRKALRHAGYRVHTVDLGEFIKAGGGAKCLTLAI